MKTAISKFYHQLLANRRSEVTGILLGGIALSVTVIDSDDQTNCDSHEVVELPPTAKSLSGNLNHQCSRPPFFKQSSFLQESLIAEVTPASIFTGAVPIILATSDGAAERSASTAAAKRFNESADRTHLNQPEEKVENDGTSAMNAFGETVNNKRGSMTKLISSNRNNHRNDRSSNNSTERNLIHSDDSYPSFTQFHNSLLKKYLTPAVWAHLSPLSTSFHTTIEDMIRPGLALPLGANPPRRIGLLVGDAECYTVFRELLNPIIWEYHGLNSERGYECVEWEDPELPKEVYFDSHDGADGKNNGKNKSSGFVSRESATTNRCDLDEASVSNTLLQPSSDVTKTYNIITSGNMHQDENNSHFLQFEDEDDQEPQAKLHSQKLVSSSSLHENKSADNPSQAMSSSIAVTKTQAKRQNLRRHSTIINNPLLVTSQQADPNGKYIISTRIRVARSFDKLRFPTTMSRSDRRRVQTLICECTQNFQSPLISGGLYLPVLSMSNDQNLNLIERHILFDNPNEWTVAAGLGRDWPDGRGLYANVKDIQTQTPDFMIWVNEEDHLRIMCLRSGGNIQGVFTTLMTGVRELERELRLRGWEFAFDPRLGYLTTCPTNVGTTLRASVHVRLVKLGALPGFSEMVERLKLEVRGKYGETDRQYTGIFDISNAERLGKSEVHLINVMVEGVAKLIELERRLERGELVDCNEIAREL